MDIEINNLWYKNPKVLVKNLDQFFPEKKLNRINKINAIARFSIYYMILLVLLRIDMKYISIGIILLLITVYLGETTKMKNIENIEDIKKCQASTRENPFMNYTLGDLIENPNRLPACKYEKTKDKIRREFRAHVYSDASDIWGRYITDRNFYTMPNTDIVNDQTGFANWCFGNSGECKTVGKNCLKQRDPTYHRGRITTINE